MYLRGRVVSFEPANDDRHLLRRMPVVQEVTIPLLGFLNHYDITPVIAAGDIHFMAAIRGVLNGQVAVGPAIESANQLLDLLPGGIEPPYLGGGRVSTGRYRDRFA